MTIRIFNAPPGLDYNPVKGERPEISFGVVCADAAQCPPPDLQHVIARRLFPWSPYRTKEQIDWSKATARPWEVLLPPGAPDALWNVGALCEAYHAGDPGLIEDLAAVITIRWPDVECPKRALPMHEAWECSRSFATKLTKQYSLAAVPVLHVPARAWARGAPHVHVVLPCRTIRPGTGFASFCKPFTNPLEGREIVDRLWGEHRDGYAFSRDAGAKLRRA